MGGGKDEGESPGTRTDRRSLASAKRRLLDRLEADGCIASPALRRAMEETPREAFLPPGLAHAAYLDTPLPIGHGQTVSAPHMVAMMCERLELAPGQRVLEVGAGCGYHAAVMARMVSPGGSVIAVECVLLLARTARRNLASAGVGNVEVVEGDGGEGYPPLAPYDRISVAAASPEIPPPLIDQLKEGGVIVIPVGGLDYQELLVARKAGGRLEVRKDCDVVFVPLTGRYGQA